MTHAELVARAVRWLRNSNGCSVVIAEMSSGAWEEPDAIGWKYGNAIVIECKTSMSDFKADLCKPHRRMSERGMGMRRYYFAEPALAERIAVHPEKPAGWGVIAVYGNLCRSILDSGVFKPHNHAAETVLLLSAIQRLGNASDRAVAARLYKHDTPSPRAEIHVAQLEQVTA